MSTNDPSGYSRNRSTYGEPSSGFVPVGFTPENVIHGRRKHALPCEP